MKNFLLLSPFFLASFAFSQAQLVLTGASYIVIDNSAKLVVENPSTNAIINSGSGGIMTESEFDQVYWFIGSGTGAYTMPFVSQAAITQIPFTANIGSAGSAGGTIIFSTYPGPTWDNNTYRPSDVTHMFDYNTNSVNNSDNVIDRFWIVDASSYGTKPGATFTFTYRDVEHTQVGNNIVEADLGAQRFHPGPNIWGDYLPQGTTDVAVNQTSGVPVVPSDFWRSWTLSEVTSPLSVELSYFKGSCDGSKLSFKWQTLSESNVDHFEVERYNGSQFEVIGFVAAQGGNGINNYSFESQVYRAGAFRLVEITTDGERVEKSVLQIDCSSDENLVSFDNSSNTLFLQFEGLINADQSLEIFDASGKLVYEKDIEVQLGSNFIAITDLQFSKGYYAIRLQNGTTTITDKIIKAN